MFKILTFVFISHFMLCVLTKGLLDFYLPPTQESWTYKNWIAVLDLKTCLECRSCHGQIYRMDEIPDIDPPLHPNCRCEIKPMEAVIAGQGTKDGQNGADYWMKHVADLPEYYMTEDALRELGWRKGKAPAKFGPGKMATMGVYQNRNGHLP
ncbi:minor capsid protein [Hydrogeniiclostridium mannosilyticum]|uniref:minor capsid protein n=1 Tax=Hydrogeniiclostridium mannosilyticum TaxID=2764322 RepID=UPI0039996A4E